MADIQLVRVESALKPKDPDPQQVAANSMVTFLVVDPRIKGTTIEFEGESSPFGQKTVSYGSPHLVTAAFNRSDRSKNIFKFRCHAVGPNNEQLDSKNGGGEIEIVGG